MSIDAAILDTAHIQDHTIVCHDLWNSEAGNKEISDLLIKVVVKPELESLESGS